MQVANEAEERFLSRLYERKTSSFRLKFKMADGKYGGSATNVLKIAVYTKGYLFCFRQSKARLKCTSFYVIIFLNTIPVSSTEKGWKLCPMTVL